MQGRNVEMAFGNDKDNNHVGTRNEIHHEPEQVAAYVYEMTNNLKKMASDADLKFLAYLIDMVHIEAFSEMNSSGSKKDKS